MFKTGHKKAQAATELAVFGAILIFLLGAIVRSAFNSGYTQNQNFKAMRMAMLASWNSSKAASTARTNASILFIEDRLSPDFNKYGDLDRNPFIANGSGTFTYEMLYPLDVGEPAANLPIMDVYINGQHFPFTTASYVTNRTIGQPGITPGFAACGNDGPYTTYPLSQQQCLQNQCLRNAREWVGGTVTESQFDTVISQPIPVSGCPIATAPSPTALNMECDASAIFNQLVSDGLIINANGSEPTLSGNPSTVSSTLPPAFVTWFENQFPGPPSSNVQSVELNQIQNILQGNKAQYKLFYSMVANGEDQFTTTPPACANPNTLACKDKALSSSLVLGGVSNTNGDLMFDLQRNGLSNAQIESQFPLEPPTSMRSYVAWQWSATAATSPSLIGLDTSSNANYPSYDIDGRLKTVTIYAMSQNPDGTPTVSYEDPQGGDIDSSWDVNSCGPKPGLQNNSQIFTFTKNGTYLQIKEGKAYNPETGQVVRSVNQRDHVDLIQRSLQLSNNTGRFCSGTAPLATVGNDGVTPNPVEVCADGVSTNCFTSSTIAQTCYDTSGNMIWVRSRLQDRRGNFWMTNAAGQLQVK